MQSTIEHTLALAVAADHPVFAGHFPGAPIVPGVLLLDWALVAIQDAEQTSALPGVLSVAKFLSPVSPGEQLLLSYTIAKNADGALQKLSIRINSATRAIATATFAAASPYR